MARRYQIWDRQSEILTPGGPVYSAQKWMEQNGWIKFPKAVPIVAAGLLNGAFLGELGEMKARAERQGAVFDDGLTNEELLQAIEDFEDELNAPVDPAEIPPSAEERTAAALEFIAMNSLPDSLA